MSNVTALKQPTAERPIALLLSQLDALTNKKKQCQAELKNIEAEITGIQSEIQDYMERSDLKEISSVNSVSTFIRLITLEYVRFIPSNP